MSARSHVVWTWVDENGDPIYVGWGVDGHYHPAKALWMSRSQYDSPLTEHLRTLEREPKRSRDSKQPHLARNEAQNLAKIKRDQFKNRGFKLFDDRPYATRCGGGARRKVLGPDLETYDSVRHAATAVGVNPSSITRWCQNVDTGWDYVN